jgi:hypothetical protein
MFRRGTVKKKMGVWGGYSVRAEFAEMTSDVLETSEL